MIKQEIIDKMLKIHNERLNYKILGVEINNRLVWMYEDEYIKYIRKEKIKELGLL